MESGKILAGVYMKSEINWYARDSKPKRVG